MLTWVPAGADLEGVLPKRFRLQRRAVLAGRVPKLVSLQHTLNNTNEAIFFEGIFLKNWILSKGKQICFQVHLNQRRVMAYSFEPTKI